MKLFTEDEANQLLSRVVPLLRRIAAHHREMALMRPTAKLASSAAEAGGGGMRGGSRYVQNLYDIGKLTIEISELGIQLKDPARGLIDFPSLRDGKVVLLCWQLGEGDSVQWWHDTDSGFAGRKPI
jgi:hypothetical protein